MAGDIAAHIHSCRSCAKAKDRKQKKRHKTKLFPETGTLDEIAIDLLGPLLKTRNENQFIIVITVRYSKLTGAVPISKTSVPYITSVMLNHCFIPNDIPNTIVSDNGSQLVTELILEYRVPLSRYTTKNNNHVPFSNKLPSQTLQPYHRRTPSSFRQRTPNSLGSVFPTTDVRVRFASSLFNRHDTLQLNRNPFTAVPDSRQIINNNLNYRRRRYRIKPYHALPYPSTIVRHV